MNKTTSSVALIAFEGISAFHLSVPCLVFKDIFTYRTPLFTLDIYSVSGQEIQSSSGFGLSLTSDAEVLDKADIVIIPSWPDHLPEPPDSLLDSLNRAYKRGAILVGLCLGSFVLAKTGLLKGKTATTHWAFIQSFRQSCPEVVFDASPLFIDHGRLITSAGTAASIDCCLHIVRKRYGHDVASEISRMMVTAPFRSGGQQQYIPSPVPERPERSTSLSCVMEEIEQALHCRYSLDEIALRCAVSRRTFTRQFKAMYGCTFGEWLLNQRLKLSQQLLERTDYPITEVAERSGFGSESVFRKHFRHAFRISPSGWRAAFNGAPGE